jgi:hypothetical protein
MAKLTVNTGTSPNDGTGDSLRLSFTKTNSNFTELYNILGLNGSVSINSGVIEWDEAYSWGDHADAGYLTTESDPIFESSPAFAITELDKSQWTDAYNWGDHDAAGYVSTTQDIVPAINNLYDLASDESRFKDLYLSGSFYLGDAVITSSGTSIAVDITGSVFAADTTLLVDSANAKIIGNIETASLKTSETKIALGSDAGKISQGNNAVAVGSFAGETSQGDFAVAIGREAGETSQGQNAVAVGRRAGETSQGESAVAIGFRAGETQADNSIVINATGNVLNNTNENTFVIKPIRDAVGTTMLMYNASTGEVTHTSSVSSISNGTTKIDIPNEDGEVEIDGSVDLYGNFTIYSGGSPLGQNSIIFNNSGLEVGKITTEGETGGAIQIQANPFFEVKVSQDDGAGGTETALWVFRSDGDLEFPDNTVQTTAWTGNVDWDNVDNKPAFFDGEYSSLNGTPTDVSEFTNDAGYLTSYAETDTLDSVTERNATTTNAITVGGLTSTGILKIDVGAQEKYQTKTGATGTVTHDCSLGHIFYHTSPSSNWTVNLTNLNLTAGYATAVTLIIEQGSTGYYPSALEIAGSAQGTIPIRWQGGSAPTPGTDTVDVVTFSIINDSNLYTALGQLTGF